MKIAILGLSHSGEIYSACLANLGNSIIGIDTNAKIVNNLNQGIPPFPEPNLNKLLKSGIKSGQLNYSTDITLIKNYSIIWFTVDTPINKQAQGNTDKLFVYLKKAIPHIKDSSLIIITSQIPAGTSQKIIKYIKSQRKDLIFNYAYIPENLRLGQAIESFMRPSRIIIGTNTKLPPNLNRLFHKLTPNVLSVTPASAEMIKHATNAFLATSLSFIYDIADVCEQVNADITEVSAGLRADKRIGQDAYIDASTGYSGGHLDRDIQYLRKIARENKINLPVISSVMSKNKKRKKIIFSKILPLLKTFKGKTICFWGITYKSGTTVLDHSLPLSVAKEMHKLGAKINLCDPWVNSDELSRKHPNVSYKYFNDPYKSVSNCHAVICITPWKELKDLNFQKISKTMKKPKIFFDARNYFLEEQDKFKKADIQYIGVGR